MISYGVVLSGGGAKGAYQLGAWMALKELNISIIGVVGTSIGSINGALMVQDDLLLASSLWEEISINKAVVIEQPLANTTNLLSLKNTEVIFKQLIDNLKLQPMISNNEIVALQEIKKNKQDNVIDHLLDNFGISTAPLKNKLLSIIDENKIRSKKAIFGITVYNLTKNKGEELYLEDIPEGKLVDYLLASSAFPGLKTVKIDNNYYLDGGLHDNTPISMLIQKGIKDIILIDIGSKTEIKNVDLNDINLKVINADNKALGGLFEISPQIVVKRINMGFFDTMKAFEKFKGEYYFFRLDDYQNFIDKYDKEILLSIEILAKLFNIDYYQQITILQLLDQVKIAYHYSEEKIEKLTIEQIYKEVINSYKTVDDLLFITIIKFNINNIQITKRFQEQIKAYELIKELLK